MVQAILTFEFIFDILEYGTMYYATRRPTELGKFNWVIDAKGNMEQPNEWEEWWSKFIFPVLQTRSFTRPFRQLPVGIGDYSHFKRFETKADPFLRKMSSWKEGDPEPLDLGLVIKESFTFSSDEPHSVAVVPFMPAQCTVRGARAAIAHQYRRRNAVRTCMKRKESVDFSG